MSEVGEVLWTPPADVRETTELGRFLDFLRDERGHDFGGFEELWRWSVSDLEGFWAGIWDFYAVKAHSPYEQVLGSRQMPGAEWFPGATLNYAEHMVGAEEELGKVAVIARSQTRDPFELTWGELREQVARARAGLQRLGIGRGDRVVAYLPNVPETLVAFLATASLGAIWASCATEFGPRSVIDRFADLEPKLLLAIAGYTYGEKPIDRRPEVAEVRAEMPGLEHVIHVPYAGGADDALPDSLGWEELLAENGPLEFEPVPFDHPLCVLFSSGTTGKPKAIIHRHGGILLEHLKNQGLSWDLQPGDRLMWFTTTAWMMWNALVSTLLFRASIVMLDGNPLYPDLSSQWRLAEELRPTLMGAVPAFLMGCRKAGVNLRDFDLSSIRQLCAAGSPLPPEGYDWVYEQLGPDVLLNVGSGGTDVCTGLVQGGPMLPVYRGEIAGRCLGVDSAAYDEAGEPVVGELGELVIREPMPSMPLGFWGDEDGSRYRASYFEQYPGVLRFGDWIRFTERGSCELTGRSDATLNRGGVRLGTGELYAVVESLDEVLDSLVVHLEDPEGGPGELILFVQLGEGVELDDELRARLAGELRARAFAPPRARHDRGGAGDPAHDDPEEARGAGEADPARSRRRHGREPRRAGRSRSAGRVRRLLGAAPPGRRLGLVGQKSAEELDVVGLKLADLDEVAELGGHVDVAGPDPVGDQDRVVEAQAVRGEQLAQRFPDVVAERDPRGDVMEAEPAVSRERPLVVIDLARDRLDQLRDQPASGAHPDPHLPLDRLVPLQEGRALGRQLGEVLDPELLAHLLGAAIEVRGHPAELPDAREEVAQHLDRARVDEPVGARRLTRPICRSPRPAPRCARTTASGRCRAQRSR